MNIAKEKIISQLGFNAPSATDLVNRADYATEEKYLAALADMAAKLNDPAVKDVLRKAGREHVEINEKAERQRQRDEFAEIRKAVKLGVHDEREINAQATQLARDELAAGKISYSDLGARIQHHAETLTEKRKQEKAAGIQFNMSLRGQRLG